jgi:hypothetical protein
MNVIGLLSLAAQKSSGYVRTLLLLLVAVGPFEAAALDCESVNQEAAEKRALVHTRESGRTTIGKGRIVFYSAPDRRCVKKGVFVLPGESLNAAMVYGGFTFVTYRNLKTEAEADGWVLSSRLKENGFGIGPN